MAASCMSKNVCGVDQVFDVPLPSLTGLCMCVRENSSLISNLCTLIIVASESDFAAAKRLHFTPKDGMHTFD